MQQLVDAFYRLASSRRDVGGRVKLNLSHPFCTSSGSRPLNWDTPETTLSPPRSRETENIATEAHAPSRRKSASKLDGHNGRPLLIFRFHRHDSLSSEHVDTHHFLLVGDQSEKVRPDYVGRADVAGWALFGCQSWVDGVGEWP